MKHLLALLILIALCTPADGSQLAASGNFNAGGDTTVEAPAPDAPVSYGDWESVAGSYYSTIYAEGEVDYTETTGEVELVAGDGGGYAISMNNCDGIGYDHWTVEDPLIGTMYFDVNIANPWPTTGEYYFQFMGLWSSSGSTISGVTDCNRNSRVSVGMYSYSEATKHPSIFIGGMPCGGEPTTCNASHRTISGLSGSISWDTWQRWGMSWWVDGTTFNYAMRIDGGAWSEGSTSTSICDNGLFWDIDQYYVGSKGKTYTAAKCDTTMQVDNHWYYYGYMVEE